MNVHAIDLNLLAVFDAMIEHRSVTRAGERIALSQPAMSAALGRLRTLFHDPLFVRAGGEMQPTPKALELAEPIRRVLTVVKTEVLQRSGFDPAVTERQFTLLTPDIGEFNFLPRLLGRFAAAAPGARLRTIARPRAAAAEALESGAADLAIGYFPDLQKAGFYQQKLFENAHVCIVRAGHPAVGDRLTLAEYLALPHAVVRPDGREHVFEQHLQHRGISRRVLLEVSHFLSVLPIVESSDLVATVPRDLADACMRYGNIRIVEVPIRAPGIAVHQFWHRRFHQDPANIWLRGLVHAQLAQLRPAASARTDGERVIAGG